MKKFPRDFIGKTSSLRRAAWLPVLCLTVVGSATAQPSPAPPKVGHTVSGRGLFLLDFDYATGRVTDVHVLKSTGNATYDAITLRNFKHWNCKPRTYTHLKVPITYTVEDTGS